MSNPQRKFEVRALRKTHGDDISRVRRSSVGCGVAQHRVRRSSVGCGVAQYRVRRSSVGCGAAQNGAA
jgi:hypothetical protein